jgi:hypothetical protein
MKRWSKIAAVVLASFIGWLSCSGIALAQSDGNTVSILSDIITPILVIISRALDYWVNAATGNTLTDPMGVHLVSALATAVQNVALFIAEFSTLLVGNTI